MIHGEMYHQLLMELLARESHTLTSSNGNLGSCSGGVEQSLRLERPCPALLLGRWSLFAAALKIKYQLCCNGRCHLVSGFGPEVTDLWKLFRPGFRSDSKKCVSRMLLLSVNCRCQGKSVLGLARFCIICTDISFPLKVTLEVVYFIWSFTMQPNLCIGWIKSHYVNGT